MAVLRMQEKMGTTHPFKTDLESNEEEGIQRVKYHYPFTF